MKQQVVVIHGGDVFDTYEEYLSDLKSKELTLQRLLSKDWKDTLAGELGEKYQVLAPRMPNSQNARYFEWKIWFEKIISLLDQEVIFIGHSLGGIFLVKYLSENAYPKHIKATLLVGTPYNTPINHPFVDFTITTPLTSFIEQAGKVVIFHSKDDTVVPYENAKKYQKDLPDAQLQIFTHSGHFNDEHFPEIIAEIKSL